MRCRHRFALTLDAIYAIIRAMDFERPLSLNKRPDGVPQQIQQERSPEAGNARTDCAAMIAARSAAVARNRQKSERAAFLRDMVRMAGVIVIIAIAGWFAYVKYQHALEEKKLQAQREETKRIQMENAKQSAKRHQIAQERFRGASLLLIAQAPASDLPAKVTEETWFSCIVSGGSAGEDLYEIRALPGNELHVSRFDGRDRTVEVKSDDFRNIASRHPFLLTRGSCCYYSPLGNGRWELNVPPPVNGVTIDPAKQDLGGLCDAIRKRGISTASFAYDVFFRKGYRLEKRILSLPFGKTLDRAAIRKAMEVAFPELDKLKETSAFAGRESGNKLDSGSKGKPSIDALLNEGRIVIRRKSGGSR